MEAQLTYIFDRANGPTKCHGCDRLIQEGRGRVGVRKEGEQLYFDYHHVLCFQDKNPQKDVRTIPGFDTASKAVQDTALGSPKKDLRLIRDNDWFGVAKQQLECKGCSEYIFETVVFVCHNEKANVYNSYHVPCWVECEARPCKPYSDYNGFQDLPESVKDEVLSSCPGSNKDIREDPTKPIPVIRLQLGRGSPKKCLAKNRDGAPCGWDSRSDHPKAKPLKQDGCYTCQVHAHVQIDQTTIDAYERRRKVGEGKKQYQCFDTEERNKSKRARAS